MPEGGSCLHLALPDPNHPFLPVSGHDSETSGQQRFTSPQLPAATPQQSAAQQPTAHLSSPQPQRPRPQRPRTERERSVGLHIAVEALLHMRSDTSGSPAVEEERLEEPSS